MAYKTIIVSGSPIRKEYKADAAITPGHLVELISTGNTRKHSVAGGSCQKRFALENKLAGKTIGDDYAAGEQVQTGVFRRGDEAYAILADGEAAVIGSKLESNGDGTLRVVDVDASVGDIAIGSIVGEALEALDMSGSSGADPSSARLRVEIW